MSSENTARFLTLKNLNMQPSTARVLKKTPINTKFTANNSNVSKKLINKRLNMMYSFESIDKPVADNSTSANILTGNLERFLINNYESNDTVSNRRRINIERRI